MIIKSIEIRDRMTFIPAIAIQMVPRGKDAHLSYAKELYLLRRCGYDFNNPAVILLRMDGRAGPGDIAPSDPYDWNNGSRTMQAAHLYVTEHFDELEDGAVVDVEYILGETKTAKESERTAA